MNDETGAIPSLLSALRALPLWMFIGLAAAAYAILFVPPFAGIDPEALRQTWGVSKLSDCKVFLNSSNQLQSLNGSELIADLTELKL